MKDAPSMRAERGSRDGRSLQVDPGSRASQNIELVAQSEVLKGEALSGSKY